MKKIMIIALVVAVSAVFIGTAMAAEWSLYGSARVETFYESTKLDDLGPDKFGRDTIKNTEWSLQNNSRIGAKVKAGSIDAQFEYGARRALREETGASEVTVNNEKVTQINKVSTNFANVRRLYGVWHFTEGWGLKVGKDYTPITFFESAQVWNADDGMLQSGNAYGGRWGQVAIEGNLGPGQLKFALIQPVSGSFSVINNPASGITVQTQQVNVTAENYWPKIEASYQMKFGDNMSAHAFGGFNNSKVYGLYVNNATGATANFSETITSWVVGLGGDFNFGPMYVKPQASYYVNGANGGWLGGSAPGAAQVTQGASLNGLDIEDANTVQAMLALGFAPTESLSLELGGGYLYNKGKDNSNLDNSSFYQVYLSSLFTMAPGVYLAPEIGLREYGKIEYKDGTPNTDLGNLWYVGAKWQIDF